MSHSATDCRLTAWTQVSAVGQGLAALDASLDDRRSGLRRNDFPGSQVDTWIGRIDGVEALDWTAEPAWESRNNALVRLGLAADGFIDDVHAARERFGPARVGVVIGTSTSSIGRTEAAYREFLGTHDDEGSERFPPEYRQPDVHNPGSPSAYVAHRTGLEGPQLTISTACASSARVFASAARWLQAGFVDAVLVGGVDSLCHSVLAGFQSLELTAPNPCRPFDAHREGINIGEAVGFALVTTADRASDAGIRLAGYGESSDAFHMSQPPPEGEGAQRSMRAALDRAGLRGDELGYVNLHGTASQANDAAEADALAAVLPEPVFVSSTKGWTGHTLGAAGILEAVITLQALRRGRLPGTLNLDTRDERLAYPIAEANGAQALRYAMTNSFGFGGNNCSLIFERCDREGCSV
ncbi:MAG: beta-ketoacyl-ACP synthase [Xanthomonadales bacterium]|nr:beta-ketoacyl-ACP synthase [Xanthomonadales bacterium]